MLTSDAIRERLQRAIGKTQGHRVYLGVATPEHVAHAVTSDEDPLDLKTPTGCLVKLMTSAALCALLRAEGASPDAPVTDFLPRSLAVTRQLVRGLQIHQLLNHTHGIDDSQVRSALLCQGYLDLEDLSLKVKNLPRLAEPGRLYSYGNIGSWLAAGIIEHIAAAPLETQLRALLEGYADVRAGCALCAASGGGLEVTAAQLLAFALREVAHFAPISHRYSVPRPGFTPVETGSCLGWNSYREGWLGHSSTTPGRPVLLRVHPGRLVAVVVATDGLNPTTIVARGLGDLYPELAQLRFPRLAGSQRCEDPGRYCGRYRNAYSTLHVERQADERLRVTSMLTDDSSGSEARPCTSLAPAEQDVFVATPAHSGLPRFLEFLGNDAAAASHLWDGERIRVRI